MLQKKTGVYASRLLQTPSISTVLLENASSILLFTTSGAVNHTYNNQETALVFQPKIIARSLSPREEASRLEGEREPWVIP